MNRDRLIGLFGCVFSICFLIWGVSTISNDWRVGVDAEYVSIGPRFFPYLSGALSLIFSALLLVFGRPAQPDEATSGVPVSVIGLVGLLLIYGVALTYLGFLPSSVVFMTVIMLLYGRRKWWIALPASVVAAYVIVLGFGQLSLNLPQGLF